MKDTLIVIPARYSSTRLPAKVLAEIDGKTIIETGSETYEAAPSYDDSNTYSIPNYLYYFGDFDEAAELQDTVRNEGGFGSTGTGSSPGENAQC